ncbi:MAG: hypothetical protein ACHQ4H_19180, partial [Ktedonobacterales bacterium]
MKSTAAGERENSRHWAAARALLRGVAGQRIPSAPRRLGRHAVNGLLVGIALLIFLAPMVTFLVTLTWAAVSVTRSLYLLVDLVHARNFAALGPQLHELNIGMRLALLSAGYFALVSALIVLYAGVLGRHWRRALLISGLLLTIPSAVSLALGAVLTGAVTGLPIQAQVAITLYVFFDAVALGCLLADTRAPVRRVRRFLRLRRYFLWQRMPYYARRFQARYAVIREALSDPESALASSDRTASDLTIQPPLPRGGGEPEPSWQPEQAPRGSREDATETED